MDDQRIGAVIRALRQRRRWRQVDLASRAGVSDSLVGRIERGQLGSIPISKVRRVAGALDARIDAIVRWQGADLGRLLDARHAGMHESMAGLLGSLDGWQFEPEVSFSIYGERGIIDILAWHPGRRMLLVIELKTEIVEVSGLLGSMDQRRRLAVGDRPAIRVGPGRGEHLGRDRREPDQPARAGGARRRAASEVPGRWSSDPSLVARPGRPDRRARLPARSSRNAAWATCRPDPAGPGRFRPRLPCVISQSSVVHGRLAGLERSLRLTR